MDLLERIFYMSTSGEIWVEMSKSLREFYHMIPETKDIDTRMEEVLKRAGLTTEEQQAEIFRIYWDNCESYEKQGFLNGVQYGVRLAREVEN